MIRIFGYTIMRTESFEYYWRKADEANGLEQEITDLYERYFELKERLQKLEGSKAPEVTQSDS